MKRYDIKLDNKSIIDSINKDYVNRNNKLNKLIEILNIIDDNRVISIDGNWGSGKTIFAKQLLLLNNTVDYDEITNKEKFDKKNIEEYQSKYITLYYNAWEYDFHTFPILSLIYNFLIKFPKYNNQLVVGEDNCPFDIVEFVKSITGNLYNINKTISYEDLCKEIEKAENTKNSFIKLLNDIIPDGKRLLFIIDELDRCKPTYAVQLLEIVKHIFDNNNITFIISTNNKELCNVINNYYGNNFDSSGYLDKFYDLVINIDEIDNKLYLEKVLNIYDDNRYFSSVIYTIVTYFKLTMRQINRIMNDIEMLNNYYNTTMNGVYKESIFLKYIVLPYCLVLKIVDNIKLDKLLKGEGFDELFSFVNNNSILKTIIAREYNIKESEENIKKTLLEEYDRFFINEMNYETSVIKRDFIDTFSLLGSRIIV